jgi:hypothetical protein
MMNTETSAETGTAQASRLKDKTYFLVRQYNSENGLWYRHGEYSTIEDAEMYLEKCMRGDSLMRLEKPVKVKYQIVKILAAREVVKTLGGYIR